MNIFLCVDDYNGLAFNNRRQSRDRKVTEKIAAICAGRKLWLNHDSAKLFENNPQVQLNVDDLFLEEAESGDYCFLENSSLAKYEKWIEKLYVFHWNRVYPSDRKLDIDLKNGKWELISSEEFAGFSHEKITLEIYKHA